MGYVAINLTTRFSTTIINYGSWSAEVAVKKLDKKQLENSGIVVQFKKALLKVGKTVPLAITWQPTSARYTERLTKEQHAIHLEVKLIIQLFKRDAIDFSQHLHCDDVTFCQ